MDLCVQGQNGLQSEFWDSQVSTDKPYLENKSKKQRQTDRQWAEQGVENNLVSSIPPWPLMPSYYLEFLPQFPLRVNCM